MKAIRVASTAVLIVLANGCQRPTETSPPTGSKAAVATASTSDSFFLESNELEHQMAIAKLGDNPAAIRIADHYGLGEAMPSKAYPWFLTAAQRGDISAMRSVGVYLSSEGGLDNCRKAVEWLERAKREASPQEDQQHGITDTYRHLGENFEECVHKRQ